jgi:molybdopterin molybdotransferase
MTAFLGPSPLSAGERSVADARAAVLAALVPAGGVEPAELTRALGRVLAADLISPIDVPPHDNSAMDGYAFDGAALAAAAPLALRVAATRLAGDTAAAAVGPGECVRIMTGAVMPAGCDTVVPQELVRLEDDRVCFDPGAVKRGENRRRRGEDLERGSVALPAGRVLEPAALGLIASLGHDHVGVRRRLRVALFSTGDELRRPGEPLDAGCIYDSNRYSLLGALQRLGAEVLDLGLIRDDPAALRAAFDRAVAECDAVVTSGGVSVGEADYTRQMLGEMGEVAFWKVAMRPGRPFAFGSLRGGQGRAVWLFALPGNPVAALVTFYAFVREALQVLAGAKPAPPPALRVRAAAPIRKRPGRTEFQRGIVERSAEGAWQVRLTGAQGAGILHSLVQANALVVLPHERGPVAAGDPVEVWLFEGLV